MPPWTTTLCQSKSDFTSSTSNATHMFFCSVVSFAPFDVRP